MTDEAVADWVARQSDEWRAGWDAAWRADTVHNTVGHMAGYWRGSAFGADSPIRHHALDGCDVFDLLPVELAEAWHGSRLLGEPWERPLVELAERVLDTLDRERCRAITALGTRCRNRAAVCWPHRNEMTNTHER